MLLTNSSYHQRDQNSSTWTTIGENVNDHLSSFVSKFRDLQNIEAQDYFLNSNRNNFRNILPSDMIYQDSVYPIDFYDLKKLKDVNIPMFLFCNLHNPVSKVWTESDYQRVGSNY